MKVNTSFTFDEIERRTVRAAHGRGGMATRSDCRIFIERAIRTALKAAPDPKPARTRTPKGEPSGLSTGRSEEDQQARLARFRKGYRTSPTTMQDLADLTTAEGRKWFEEGGRR